MVKVGRFWPGVCGRILCLPEIMEFSLNFIFLDETIQSASFNQRHTLYGSYLRLLMRLFHVHIIENW